MQDIRIVNCGELIRKAKPQTKKKEKSSASDEGEASSDDSSSSSSESSSSSSEEEKKKKKKKNKKEKKKKSKKEKKNKRKHKDSSIKDYDLKSADHPLATLTNIDPDEIPDVPSNRYVHKKIREICCQFFCQIIKR